MPAVLLTRPSYSKNVHNLELINRITLLCYTGLDVSSTAVAVTRTSTYYHPPPRPAAQCLIWSERYRKERRGEEEGVEKERKARDRMDSRKHLPQNKFLVSVLFTG